MRKITMEACQAFESGRDFKKQNMRVWVDGYTVFMSLHGNIIAKIVFTDGDLETGILQITLAGWNTNTTRERLNGLDGVRVSTKQGQAYLNGKEWDGEWITVPRSRHADGLRSVAMVAMMGDIFHAGDQKASNDWKARMLKAGLENKGLIMPDNWGELSEEEKQKRLDGAINSLINE